MRFFAVLAPAGCVAVAMAWFVLASYPPAAAQQANPPRAELALKVYPCLPIHAQAIAAQLREDYRGVPGVRIGADDRLGQILVEAPPGVQAEIARHLTPTPQNTGSPPAQVAPAIPPPYLLPSATVPAGTRSVQLRHATARQVEAGLVSALGKRLVLGTGGGPAVRNYHLGLPDGKRIDLSIDHQANRVTLQGQGTTVDSCLRLIQALDRPALPRDRGMRLLHARHCAATGAGGTTHVTATP